MFTNNPLIERYRMNLAIGSLIADIDKFVEEQGKCAVCSKYLAFGDPKYTPHFFCSAECDLQADRDYDNYEEERNERAI